MNTIKEKEASSRELHAIEYIAALDKRMNDGERHLEERLKMVPDLWRQYRIARTAIDKVVEGLYKTMELRALYRLMRMSDNSELVFRPRSPLNDATDARVVLDKDLSVLVTHVLQNKCCFCLNEGKDVKNCELRKALMNIIPLSDVNDGALCGYTDAASSDSLSEYK